MLHSELSPAHWATWHLLRVNMTFMYKESWIQVTWSFVYWSHVTIKPMKFSNFVMKYQLYNNIQLLNDMTGNIDFCVPEGSHVSQGRSPRETWLAEWSQKSCFLSYHSTTVLLYSRYCVIKTCSIECERWHRLQI